MSAFQFIRLATGNENVVIGHELQLCTQEIQAFRCPHPKYWGRTVVFIDTPGFGISYDMNDILQDIANWLTSK